MNTFKCRKWPLLPCKSENDAVNIRRTSVDLPLDLKKQPLYGLALSGGGIRSATFSLGLVRAMATNRVFKRFDYMSTVSGGGYLGGMVGKLYSPANNANVVEAGLSSKNSVLLWWIRNNGRYLTPAGARDTLMALTQMLRAFFFNFLLMTWMATLVCAPALWTGGIVQPEQFGFFESVLSVVILWTGTIYWFTGFNKWIWMLIALSLLFLLYWIYREGWLSPFSIYEKFSVQLTSKPYANAVLTGAATYSLFLLIHCLCVDQSRQRNLLTRYLLCTSLFAIGTGIFYGLGRIGEVFSNKCAVIVIITTLLAGKLVTILLNKIERARKTLKKAKHNPHTLGFANLAGLVVAAMLLIAGTIGLSWLQNNLAHDVKNWSGYLGAIAWLVVIALTPFKVIPSLLNLSSMHNFYRARLERAWLSVGNTSATTKKEPRFPLNILDPYDRVSAAQINQVTDVMKSDETQLKDYQPWINGGPIHLITCCINQTIDDRTGMYNADRKGLALTLGPLGVETGTQLPLINNLGEMGKESLAQWIAISGAAFSTGLGSRTAPGISFLSFLFGVRTGFWHSNPLPHKTPFSLLNIAGGAGYITGEMFARFPDLKSKQLYLTDGGHFENTGVYPLLKREIPLIVVADCGADPEFIFDDLENLVRKAHIDYAAAINFYDFRYRYDRRKRKFTSMKRVRESDESPPYLLARITYRSGMIGTLLVVKPHKIGGLSLDTLAYGEREVEFPQQTTLDQFFDESQWEAYHQLGLQMGEHITARLLRHLMAFTQRFKP